ncbi:hypothetical protein AB0A81_31490 [Streptomyces flaveolus]|uniref:Uncharacterized protein n=1 Tax=Streptomyces flaveolus TaxID=67297 RepID=A0ABV1VKJ3_9ACTN
MALAQRLIDEQGIRAAVEQTLARRGGRSRLLVAEQFETLLADPPDTARRLDAMPAILTARRTDGSHPAQVPAQVVVVARIGFLRQIGELPISARHEKATSVVNQIRLWNTTGRRRP